MIPFTIEQLLKMPAVSVQAIYKQVNQSLNISSKEYDILLEAKLLAIDSPIYLIQELLIQQGKKDSDIDKEIKYIDSIRSQAQVILGRAILHLDESELITWKNLDLINTGEYKKQLKSNKPNIPSNMLYNEQQEK